MDNPNDDDMALQTLLSTCREISPDLDEKILRHCYQIQKKHQFNDDRTQSAAAMERLIDEFVSDSNPPQA